MTTQPGGNGGNQPLENLAFSVDTHILRELGALLVGRDSTALVELIKNAYDADASRVVVYGERLGEHGSISVSDDGHGMTYADFRDKFLRIAGRSKEGGARRSPINSRKYTGAKGIGRLSAHKLGENLALESVPDLQVLDRGAADVGFDAEINWTSLEASHESIEAAKQIEANPGSVLAPGTKSGTLLTISKLHSEWTPTLLNRFLAEVRSTRADPVMYESLSDHYFADKPLMPTISVSDSAESDPGFTIELTGDFEGSEAQWPTLLSHVSWMLEIDALSTETVAYRITPSKLVVGKRPEVVAETFTWVRDTPGPTFSSRIFIRDGMSTQSSALPDLLTKFASDAAGIRLFFEGFRVLPYGTPRNDWLGLGHAASQRSPLDYLDDVEIDDNDDTNVNEKTYQLSNSSYFGAVFLHDEGSAGMQMVVNREGFLPGPDYEQMVEIVKRGINISTRMRAAIGARVRDEKLLAEEDEREARRADVLQDVLARPQRGAGESPPTTQEKVDKWLHAGEQAAASLRASSSSAASDAETAQNVAIVTAVLEEVRAVTAQASDEQAQLRVLASLGTQIGAFVHEVESILVQARIIGTLLQNLIDNLLLDAPTLKRLRAARNAQAEVVTALERQSVYLTDSLGADARRKRVRSSVGDRWATAMRLLAGAAARRDVAIVDQIPANLRTPPMFPAEINVILTNVLSNAIKAAAAPAQASFTTDDKRRQVTISGYRESDIVRIVVENTGTIVDLDESERWFRPFETTTTEVDAALGQGLGLGLSLTRRIVEEYGGGIRFIAPTSGKSTAVEIWLPDRR